MRKTKALIGPAIGGLALAVALAFGGNAGPSHASPAGPPDHGVRAAVGSWDPESGLGYHRAVVHLEATPASAPDRPYRGLSRAVPAKAARVVIPWRRRDLDPEKKAVIVVDAATGERLANVLPISVGRESGEFVFEPRTVPGDYYFYYLPYKSEGRKNYPNVKYDAPQATADPAWLDAIGLAGTAPAPAAPLDALPPARFIELQSVDEFSAFTPMELIATAEETRALLAGHPGAPYLLFPEDRSLSIRMADDLPGVWAIDGPAGAIKGSAARGESYAFQIGFWAARQPASDLEIEFSDLVWTPATGAEGSPALPPDPIPAKSIACLNKGGISWDALRFKKTLPVPLGKIQALWCVIQVPVTAFPGVYKGTATVVPAGLAGTIVAVELTVSDKVLPDGGDSDPFRMGRLRWLDSTLAQDDGLVPPYGPVTVDRFKVGCLGRTLAIGRDGLPARIESFFAPEMTRLQARPVDVTAAPIRLVVAGADGDELAWKPSLTGPRVGQRGPGAAAWEADNCNGDFLMRVEARMEFDGFVDYRIALTARRDLAVEDIRLEVPWAEPAARYMMGLGFKGGLRPASFDWAWDRKKNQDALWIGSVNAGMQVGLRAENYSRPLNTNFYLSKPLNMPPSWWNEGQGRVTVRTAAGGAVMTAASGPRSCRAGDVLHFDFTLLITPFKPIDPAAHFRERYFHAFEPLDKVAATGANVINVHHANAINPYINYPFLRPAEMKAYVDDAHRRGFKVKIYDTVRELSNHAPELFALRSLGHEIFSPGPGGGYAWLQEHLGSDYIAAWFVPDLKDAAVINSGLSRWHNYYIEGLDWLARNVGIDGLYLDDVAFDRTTMKRVRKVLDRIRPGALIDLHSANQYNVRDGFASSANLYLEHFPYLNRLWFGEYFDYNGSGPDYWLVEISGLPFGLMGEMLQDGGNPWRGMVFGMTARLPWAGDPRPLWHVWDEFGITESEMIGWWVETNPVKTGRADVLATVYARKGRNGAHAMTGASANGQAAGSRTGAPAALIALASWAKEPVEVSLAVDWKALGLDPKTAKISAPAIEKFQDAAAFKPGGSIRVEPGKGLLLVVR
jgi:hypothetical protein